MKSAVWLLSLRSARYALRKHWVVLLQEFQLESLRPSPFRFQTLWLVGQDLLIDQAFFFRPQKELKFRFPGGGAISICSHLLSARL